MSASELSAVAVRWICPVEVPARTKFGSAGATAIAETEPCRSPLAWLQFCAALRVRHICRPPVQSRVASPGSTTNGAMKLNPLLLMPVVAAVQRTPPSTDLRMDSPVVAA